MFPRALLSLLLLAVVEAGHHASHAFLGVHQGPAPEGGYKDISADDQTCYLIWFFIMVGFFINVFGMVFGNVGNQMCGSTMTLAAATIGTFYIWQHGLLEAWWAGTIDPVEHKYCAAIAPVALIMYFYFACCFCCCGMFVAASLMARMAAERQQKEAELLEHAPASIKHIQEPSFREKCEKAFKEADADGNGKLDLSELQHVVAFDLTDEEKEMVQSMHLWDEAFVKQDVNKDNFIDMEEFVEVMKWVQVTVKHAEEVKKGTIPTAEKAA